MKLNLMPLFIPDDAGQDGDESQYCPNCGAPIESDDAFCPNCAYELHSEADSGTENGTDIGTDAEQKSEPESEPKSESDSKQESEAEPEPNSEPNTDSQRSVAPEVPITQVQQPTPQINQPMSKANKIKLGVAAGLIVVLVGTYFGLKNYYSPVNQTNRIIKTIDSKNAGKIAKIMTAGDASLTLNAKSVQPFVDFLKSDKEYLSNTESNLRNGSATIGNMGIVSSGKVLGMFPKYSLHLPASEYIRVGSTKKAVVISENGKKLFTTTSDKKTTKAGPLVPGRYVFDAKGKIAGRNMSSKYTVDITDDNSQDVSFNFTTVKLKLKSNLEGGFVTDTSGDKLGTIKDGKLTTGKIAFVKGLKFFVTKKFGDQTVTTKRLNPIDYGADGGDVVISKTLNGKGGLSKSDADSVLNDVSSALDEGAAGTDSEDAEYNLADYFTSTSDSGYKFFNSIISDYSGDSYMDSNFYTKVRSVKWLTANTWDVNYDITYDIVYADDRDDRVQTFNNDVTFVKDSNGKFKISTQSTTMPKVYDNNANTASSEWGDSDRDLSDSWY